MEDKNYSKTLNLPKTTFGMKANLVQKEPELLKKWESNRVYEKSIRGKEEYILHDGPPYANGDIHVGTAFNKILKDSLVKYKRLKGYKVKFIPGWDTHGLPIELAVLKNQKEKIEDKNILRKKFRNHALKFIERHKKDFKRLGVLADWENPYVTLNPKFEKEQLNIFSELVDKGYIYHSLKPVYWCTVTTTALAEAEIVYKNHISDSIYFKLKVSDEIDKLLGVQNLYFAVWTTTPWTLPANLAVALNSNLEYVIAKVGEDNLILAEDLLDKLKDKLSLDSVEIIKRVKAKDIENKKYSHPFINREGLVILGNHVTSESGTGCVHTAPGHGVDDFIVGKKYGLDVLCPVNGEGVLTEEAGEFKGTFYKDANMKIIDKLKESNSLLLHEKIEHSYPYSERGKAPIIFRATEQWFVDTSSTLKNDSIKEIDSVDFFPKVGYKRLKSMLSNRPNWCISRQRDWGVPIPVFYCTKCNKALLDSNLIREISEEVGTKGSNIFFSENAEYFLKGRYSCCGEKSFVSGKDIFDVWFDSGVTYASVLEDNKKANIYLEGSDQHRGWFQTSLLTSVGARGHAPYKSVVTHGFVVDGQGIKMSKSIGNVIAPQEIVNKYGADILRLWACSVDYTGDVKISEDILTQTVETYRKIRNSFKFILGNIYDLNKSKEEVKLLTIDRLMLDRLNILIRDVDALCDKFTAYQAISLISTFISSELSSFYFDIIKDRLYTYGKDSNERASAQIVLKEICYSISKMLSPYLSFTMEEVYSHLEDESIFLSEWPTYSTNVDIQIWNDIFKSREIVNLEIEKLIEKKDISSSLESDIELSVNSEIYNSLKSFSEEELKEIFKVANITLKNGENRAEASKTKGTKCLRCWKYFNTLEDGICKMCKESIE